MKIKKCKKGKLVDFPVIVAASKGDVEAVNQVLQHYEGYIISLSTRTLYDEFSNPHATENVSAIHGRTSCICTLEADIYIFYRNRC